jgi:hypothetical protein
MYLSFDYKNVDDFFVIFLWHWCLLDFLVSSQSHIVYSATASAVHASMDAAPSDSQFTAAFAVASDQVYDELS